MASYDISAQFNNSYAFHFYPTRRDYERLHVPTEFDAIRKPGDDTPRCESCWKILHKWEAPLTGFVVKKRQYDISATYDGIVVVSNKFKSIYESSGLTGLGFKPLPSDPAFFAILPTRTVAYDVEKRKPNLRMLLLCPVCGQYDAVAGANPICLKQGEVIGESEFVRTDVEFGGNNEMHPLILCGARAGETLKTARLRGLCIEDFELPSTQ